MAKKKTKFTSKEVHELCQITPAFLTDLTRTKGKRPPLFTPSYPAQGSGDKNLYSFFDLMLIGVIQASRFAKIQRVWIPEFIAAAKYMNNNERKEFNPFSLSYLDYLVDEKNDYPWPLEAYIDDNYSVSLDLSFGQDLVIIAFDKDEYDSHAREGEEPMANENPFSWLKGNTKQQTRFKTLYKGKPLPKGQKRELERTVKTTVRIRLNEIHYGIKVAGKELGYF